MIQSQILDQGNFLFRYRSFLPFALLPFALYFGYAFLQQHMSETEEHLLLFLSFAVSCIGFAIRGFTTGYAAPGTSGRNTTKQIAQSLNTTGIYSVVRHPLYLGNYVVFLGFVMAFGSLSFLLISSLAYAIYYERIMVAEEAFISKKFGPAYAKWAQKTPAFFPDLRLWQASTIPFSLRRVLRKEGPGFMLICLFFPMFEIIEDVVCEGQGFFAWAHDSYEFIILAGVGVLTYFVLKALRKKTTLLDDERQLVV